MGMPKKTENLKKKLFKIYSKKFKVCCSDGVEQSGGAVTQRPPIPAPSGSKLPRPGSNECGGDTSDRIYGGNVTKIDEYPWLALLEYTKCRCHSTKNFLSRYLKKNSFSWWQKRIPLWWCFNTRSLCLNSISLCK